ncbi:DUF6876 family protein [Chryseobacterium sp.]|uniref:DUF6876 family protein n=1 Tax=Chryseobacterium sp. TaxID=1871047 RepID=UPI0025C52427|nr:DUF6876 family protein [Chryseobacterium sp.]
MASIQGIVVKNAVGMLATDGRSFSGCKSINPVSAQKNLFGILKKFAPLLFANFPRHSRILRTKRFRSLHSFSSIPVLADTEFLSSESNEKRLAHRTQSKALFTFFNEQSKININPLNFLTMKNPGISANEFYNHLSGTEQYYTYFFGFVFTDGVKIIAEEEQCFWLIDCIVSYQLSEKFRQEEFQVWKLERVKETQFRLTATDGNNKVLATQDIPFSDFFFNEFTIWKEGNVLLLPIEH